MPRADDDPDDKIPGLNIRAIFTNDYYMVVDPTLSRFTFGEKVGQAPANPHTVLVMPTAAAREFAQLLLELSNEWFPDKAKKDGTPVK